VQWLLHFGEGMDELEILGKGQRITVG